MSIGPTNPFHIARAYGAPAAPPTRPAPTPAPPAAANVARLSAGVVARGVDFTAAPVAPAAGDALPLYRHPADKNAAATAVLSAGRVIDVKG